MASLNTPKEQRDQLFYQDQFTSATNWGASEFEKFVEALGITESEEEREDRFSGRAWRVWEQMSDADRASFASDFDDWLDG